MRDAATGERRSSHRSSHLIASHMPKKAAPKGRRRGPHWTADEEEQLLDAVGAGLDWTATARAVGNGGRSVAECVMRLEGLREKARREELDPLHMVARDVLSSSGYTYTMVQGEQGRAKTYWSGKRCNACAQCTQPDCGECVNCLDKGKFGGPNIRKQSCELRACRFPGNGDHKQKVREHTSQDQVLEQRPTPREAAVGGQRGPPPPARAPTPRVNRLSTACRVCPACLRPNCG